MNAGSTTPINNYKGKGKGVASNSHNHHHRALDLFFSNMRHFVSPEGVADYILGRNDYSKNQPNRNRQQHTVKTRKLQGMLQLTSFRVMVAALIEGGEGPYDGRRCCTHIFESDLANLNKINQIERVSVYNSPFKFT